MEGSALEFQGPMAHPGDLSGASAVFDGRPSMPGADPPGGEARIRTTHLRGGAPTLGQHSVRRGRPFTFR